MIFGIRNQLRHKAFALYVALALGAVPPWADLHAGAQWGFDDLMNGLSQVRSARTKFVEDSYLKILTKPLRSEGELLYIAPGHLEKNQSVPTEQRITIDGDQLTIRGTDGKTRKLGLQEVPAVGLLVQSLRAILSGDAVTLREANEVQFSGNAEQWRLTLQPRGPNLRKVVQLMQIDGHESDLTSVDIDFSDGDKSVMTLHKPSP